MKKTVIGTLVAAFILSGTHAFAQFKDPAKAAKNLANLDRVVASATKKPSLGPAKLPSSMVAPGNAGLTRAILPKTITPVNKSYFKFVQTWYGPKWDLSPYSTLKSTAKALKDRIEKSALRPFYTRQEKLAQNLDEFYQGKADMLIGPDGRKVKLYALPADGILYKPEGYSTPLVLNANDYFVIYDVEARTGKIAENKPEVYNLFKQASEEEIYGEFEGYEVEPGIGSWRPKDPAQYYKWKRDLARDNPWRLENWEQGQYPSQFTSQQELAEALYKFDGKDVPRAHNLATDMVRYVYELPKPVVLAQPGVDAIKLNPKDWVVVYEDVLKSGYLVKRSVIENPELFKFSK